MKKLAVIGAGSMAEALIAGMIENGLVKAEHIYVTNKSNEERLERMAGTYGVHATHSMDEVLTGAEAVILAMKPKDAAEAMERLVPYLNESMLIISVLAGVPMESIERLSRLKPAIIRAMPNTSAAVCKSATALAANLKATQEQAELAREIFETVGTAVFVEEDQLDAVTGLSGSGPAYIYYLAEAMEKSAAEAGLDQSVAKELIIQTLAGAAAMLARSDKEPEELRRNVTSPGGTTEAGIRVLDSHGVQEAFMLCIKEAALQSGRLGKAITEELRQKNSQS
ncbi:pyrroline-5-carboxylate reductase [Bacillus infantis]|uniref:Pyrroline-5-carboxylate reductase n=1 Tax=Bacillus infantis TaxID=324767 RepID=A0A5D4RHP8_9BACI|nr:pyrroline-5-carboxylate reductase [Bacillus infantis]TYS49396.1 pyrroline-5-carboxylate reductase [Bacillus infantis]